MAPSFSFLFFLNSLNKSSYFSFRNSKLKSIFKSHS